MESRVLHGCQLVLPTLHERMERQVAFLGSTIELSAERSTAGEIGGFSIEKIRAFERSWIFR